MFNTRDERGPVVVFSLPRFIIVGIMSLQMLSARRGRLIGDSHSCKGGYNDAPGVLANCGA